MQLFNSTARAQANAVRAYLEDHDGIECSWCEDSKRYIAYPEIHEWHNGRENGFVVVMKSKDYKRQINIAFFEHRNSDNICAIVWEQVTMNPPTIDTAEFGNVYKDKYDVSKSVRWGEAKELADYIYNQLEEFWEKTA